MSDDSEFETCPICPHHKVLWFRLRNHITRCRVQQERKGRKINPFTLSTGELGPLQREIVIREAEERCCPDSNSNSEAHQLQEETWDNMNSPSYILQIKPVLGRPQKPPSLLSRKERHRWTLVKNYYTLLRFTKSFAWGSTSLLRFGSMWSYSVS